MSPAFLGSTSSGQTSQVGFRIGFFHPIRMVSSGASSGIHPGTRIGWLTFRRKVLSFRMGSCLNFHVRLPVRTFVTTLLTGLVLACPFLCGVAEAVEGPLHHHAET